MMELFPNIKIFTVSELTLKIKDILENNFENVLVKGEISNVGTPVSGHIYFTLKDNKSQLRSVLFKGRRKNIKFEIEDGLEVLCFGRLTVYQPRGQYQLIVEDIEPKGIGALQLAFWQLRKKLEKEGLFSEKHKKEIPFLPSKIGIITSSTGKAIKDILNIINRRFSNLEILLLPVKVQGKKAAQEIASAVEAFNRYKDVDVIILGRGGGSLEDLWAFNEEVVARAIFNSTIPIISAVGHEPDVTISDLVADLRASTPSTAAEMVVEKKEQLEDCLDKIFLNIYRLCLARLDALNSDVKKISESYFLRHPDNFLLFYQQKLDEISFNIDSKVKHFFELEKEKFSSIISRIDTLNPFSVLSRGYSITTKLDGNKIVKNSKSLKKGDLIKTIFYKGKIISKVNTDKGEN